MEGVGRISLRWFTTLLAQILHDGKDGECAITVTLWLCQVRQPRRCACFARVPCLHLYIPNGQDRETTCDGRHNHAWGKTGLKGP